MSFRPSPSSPGTSESSAPADPFDKVEAAIAAIAAGQPVIVTDDASRENEGDLVMAASLATPETVNLMIRWARGLICVPMADSEIRRLGLNPMVQHNRESMGTAFTVSVDAAEGITTGISAAERAHTIRLLADPAKTPADFVQPGHVFPLRARPGGVLERAGHTEAGVDLAELAGLPPVAVICEILNEDGSCARLPELIEFKRTHQFPMISIASLIEYRHRRDQLVDKLREERMETDFGPFTVHVYRGKLDGAYHFALTCGELNEQPTLVRVHGENVLADVFAVRGMGSRSTLYASIERIAKEGTGVILYMGRGCGGLELPPLGPSTSSAPRPGLRSAPMDFRAYGIGAQILASLGLRQIRLLTSSDRKVVALEGYGLEIVENLYL